ncbi:uncharacterized protein [Linepithema humile]|uniref:uncharacterized protein n=1 Tax=Linepithema humile TaxID=83485 RepID=UPI00351F66C7
MEEYDYELVQTCGMCEEIINQKDVITHGCLEGYSSYTVDPNTFYFYPLADDGVTIIRRSNKELVEEPFDNNMNNVSQKEKRNISGERKQITFKRSKLNDNSEIKLNFDEEELLILEVQKRPPLWDYSLPLMQRRCTIKQRLWAEIVLALNVK